jgi:membrane protein required for colicin V production
MSFTILDAFVVLVVLISAILAMVRGFVREVLSVASWVAAVAAAYFFYEPFVPLVRPYIDSPTVATVVTAAAIFFIALIVASYLTMRIADFVIDSRAGVVDRMLGFVYGAARGVLLVVIALLFFGWLVPDPPSWVTRAMTKPTLDSLGEELMAALPEDIESSLLRRFRSDDEPAGPDQNTPPPANDPDLGGIGNQTYAPDQRRGLDQLIESSDSSR